MAERPQIVATRCNTYKRINEVAKVVSCIEVDLMSTRDNNLVVGHPTVFQARNYTLKRAKIEEGAMSFDELARIIFEKDLFVFLDLKHEDMGKLVAEEVLRLKLEERVVIISWSQQNLVAVYYASEFPQAAVCGRIHTGWIVNGALEDPSDDCDRFGNNYFVTCSYYLNEGFLRSVEWHNNSKHCQNGLVSPIMLCVRDVKNKSEALRVARLGVDYLFVNLNFVDLRALKKTLGEIVL